MAVRIRAGSRPFHDDDDLIRLGPAEVGLDECVPPTGRRLNDRRAPRLGLGLNPPLVLRGDVAEYRATHRILLSVGVEESYNPLRLLKRLNQPVDQDPIEAPIGETNAIVVMLVEGVHGWPPGVSTPKDTAMNAPTSDRGSRAKRAYNQPRALPSSLPASPFTGISRAEPLAG
jgi:hypothetical protein